MPMSPRLLRPRQTGFTPRSIPGLALWLDAADSSTLYTTDAGPVTAVSAPTEISGCVGWWDASDASSITQSGGLVSQWNDKSGNGNHAAASGTVRPTTGTRTIGGRNALDFDGVDDIMRADGLAGVMSGIDKPATVFVVVDPDTPSVNSALASWWNPNLGPPLLHLRFDGLGWVISKRDDSVANLITTRGVSASTNPLVYSTVITGTAASIFENGTVAHSQQSVDVGQTTITAFSIGASRDIAGWFDGAFAEVIVYNTALSSTDRARVEAYLAAKWGISGVHAPATATNDPVGAWLDKSGNGRHMLQPSSSPRPVRSTQNNRPSLSFNGTNSTLTGSYSNADVAGAGGAAYFAAFRPASDDTYSVMNPNGDGGHRDRFSNGQAFPAVFRGTRLNNVLTNMMPVASAGLLSHVVAAGVSHQIRLDGAIRHTAADDFAAWRARGGGLNGYKIGDSGQGDFLSGTIGEILIYGRALSATEVVRIERYLAAKWGITLAPQVSNADAQDWVNRVYQNGGTVSATTANAVNQFCLDIENAGIRDRFYRLNLFCGNSDANLAAVRTPLYRGPSLTGTQYGNATDTNVNFVQGDYAENVGLSRPDTGNPRHLDTGLQTASMPSGVIDSGHLSVWHGPVTYPGNGVNWQAIGAYNATIDRVAIQVDVLSPSSGGETCRYGRNTTVTSTGIAGNRPSAFLLTQRTSATNLELWKDGSNVASTTTSTTGIAGISFNIFVFRVNLTGTAFGDSPAAALRHYSIGDDMTSAQVLAFRAALSAFNTAMGRTA